MNEMWFDDLDNRMRKASQEEQNKAVNNSWEQMESLLDKHLPVKKKRRRFFFWWFLLPALLAGTGIIFFNKKQEKTVAGNISYQQNALSRKPTVDKEPGIVVKNTRIEKAITAAQEDQPAAVKITDTKKLFGYSENISGIEIISSDIEVTKKAQKKKLKGQDQQDYQSGLISIVKNNDPPKISHDYPGSIISSISVLQNDTSTTANQKEEAVKQLDPIEKMDTSIAIARTSPITKTKKSTTNRLSLLVGAGPDLSSIQTKKKGTWKVQYGIGLQYHLSNKFSLRTGVYSSRKIYVVAPKDYHPPSNFWQYYPQMEKIDADCKVYEIPVSVVFNVWQKRNSQLYMSAGLSSYIMNKEEYGYHYKDNQGNYRYTKRAAPEKDVSLFSVIGFSGGYSYKVNNKFSLTAEPYLRMTTSGIGYGNVKLTSGGIMVNAAFRLIK